MDTTDIANKHISVLLHELVSAIDISLSKQNIIVDATLWMAGHACEVIPKLQPGDIFIGFDADTRNLPLATQRIQGLSDISLNICLPGEQLQVENKCVNILLIHSNFEHLKTALEKHDIHSITGIY